MTEPSQNPPEIPRADESKTGLPILRSWGAVYLFVTGVFITYVVILTILTRLYR